MKMFAREDLALRFAPLRRARGVLLAVSGGPDSMALLRLAQLWKQQDAAALPLAVATVDHGLRAGSRQEAEKVAEWADSLSLPHRILTWAGDKPKTRIQERAREARYRLLCAHAAEIGADHLLTAHHADDQAETILFRLLRGSGLAGLAGMPQITTRDGIAHLRPLLDCPKSALVAFCEAQGQPFLRDPSNDNPTFARVRLRRLLPLLAEEGLDREALLRLGRRAARADHALDASVEKLRAGLPAFRDEARFVAPIGALAGEPAEIFSRIVEAEIARLAGARPLRLDRLEALAESLQAALQQRQSWRGSLAGRALVLDPQGILTIVAEKPRRRGRLTHQATENSPLREARGSDGPDPVTSG